MDIDRRRFLKSAAFLASAPTLTLFHPDAVFGEDTRLIPHATHYGPFKAVVKQGKLIGVQPLKDIDAMPTQMLTKGVLGRTYDETRVKYPMVRKSYLDAVINGSKDYKVELRGREEFVRVSWDVALGLTAKAILDTIDKYGNEGIFSSSYGGWSHAGIFRPNVLQGRFFNLIGGSSLTSGDYSGGASQISLPHIIGDMEVYSPQTSWEQIRDNTQIFCMVGCDPFKNNRIEYRVADHQMYPRWESIKRNGVKFISINPQYTITDDAMDCEWVKIRPGTDTALFLSMCYYLYKNNLHDKAYLDKYTVGFDKFSKSLTGEDGSPEKTPAWASGITGIPEERIIELANLFAKNRTQFAGAWSLQRQDHGEMQHWAIIAFASMLGSIGKPGEGVGFSWHYGNGGMPVSGKSTPSGLSQGRNMVKTFCPASRITEMILNPGKEFLHNGGKHTYPRVKMIYNSGNNFMSHQQDTNKLIGALKEINTIVCQDPWWCASTRWSDIVLPATSTLERNDISSGGTYSNDKIYAMRKAIDPVAESLDDIEIFRRLSRIFNVEYQFMDGGKSVMQIIEEAYGRSSATMPFKDFWEEGVALMEVPESADKWVRHGDFYKDPDKSPLATKSGKIELYCQDFADYQLKDCPPVPTFIPPYEYLGNAEKDEVHVVSPHPRMRLHSQMANADIRSVDNIRDREACLINTADARQRGIKNGDLIEVYNKRGSIIVGAVVDDRIMKGVVSIYEGCWPSLDKKGRCNSGLVNFLTSDKPSSDLTQATTANTVLARVRLCKDAEPVNKAYTPPDIINKSDMALDASLFGLARVSTLRDKVSSDLSPGEKLFYQRCTVCHGPKDTTHFTKLQWKGITQSMFPRAGLNPQEQDLVMDFLMKNAKDS